MTLLLHQVNQQKQKSNQLLTMLTNIHLGKPEGLPLIVAIIATVLTLLVAVSILVIVLLLWHHKRTHRLKIDSNIGDLDDSYSTLDRGTKQQIQQQSINTPADLYGHIQLSPLTGQSELASKNESEDKPSTTPDHHHIQESDVSKTKCESLETGKYNSGNLTYYAVVNKQTKKKVAKSDKSKGGQANIIIESIPNLETFNNADQEEKSGDQVRQKQGNLDEMYAVVHKKPKNCEEQEESAPQVPSHTTECLYTAVQKRPSK